MLRKNDTFSEAVNILSIRTFISSIAGVTIDDAIRPTYEASKEYYMEIYLEYFDVIKNEFLLDEASLYITKQS